MKKVAKAAIFSLFALSLTVGSVPVVAKQDMSTRDVGNLKIESKQGLSLRSSSLVKKLSQLEASSSKLVVIQFTGPIEQEWKDQLEEMGVEFGGYIPDFAFVAKLKNKSDRKEITDLSFVEKVTSFQPAYKLAPELANNLDSSKQQIAVVGFDSNKDATRLVKKVAPKAESVESTSYKHIATASASGNEIEKLLESDDVLAVVPVPPLHYANDVAAGIIHSDTLTSTGYTGKNQIVGVADSGLDTGNINRIHSDFVGRIKKLIAVGREGDASDQGGHGTHVAGSIVGTGKASNGKVKGMAPEAKLVFHSMDNELQELTGDLYKILDESYKLGARIHSDSWGADTDDAYGYNSYEADKFLWEHKDMTALVAAGNDGENGFETILDPGTAKNVISVGASENNRPNLDAVSDNPNEVAYFSSNGPTADGRIKPDIVAPGTFILSTRSSLAPDDSFWAGYNKYYAYMGGTSMATPILAGGTAQVRQFLQEKGTTNPSSALIKSMLLTGADDLALSLYTQGFGRANLVNTIQTTYVDETKGLQTNGSATYSVDVTDTSKPFVLTLAWTDYPSALYVSRNLVNNLNLVVTAPNGQVFNGNDFDETPADETDNLNNVEQVYIPNPTKGKWTVTVKGYNIPYGPQPYAIATNGNLGGATSGVKEVSKTGTVTSTSGSSNKRYIDYAITVKQKGTIKASLTWDTDADLSLYLKNSKGSDVAKSVTSNKPEEIQFEATSIGTYKVRVYATKGTGKFKLSISYPGS